MKLVSLFKLHKLFGSILEPPSNKDSSEVEQVVKLSRRTIEEIKHGCKCRTCGQKFYPKKLVIKGDQVDVLRLCKMCE